jgi:hypothetical protein
MLPTKETKQEDEMHNHGGLQISLRGLAVAMAFSSVSSVQHVISSEHGIYHLLSGQERHHEIQMISI